MTPHNKIEYYTGHKFGNLIYLGEAPTIGKHRRSYFKCYCGIEFASYTHKIKTGETKSCGCLQKETTGNATRTHGLGGHPLYKVWRSMKARCYNVKTQQYKDYGGKGIFVCVEWLNDFDGFYNWAIANGWRKGLQIDKDIKGDGLCYSPQNCSFVTPKENSNKRSTSRYISYNGQEKTVSEWADHFKISLKNLYQRLSRGWSVEKCFGEGGNG